MSELDISPFLEAKSDQVTADDLIGGPRTFRVARVEMPGGEQPVLVHLEGLDGKPFKPCKGMRRLLAAMWGLDAAHWVGRSVTLFRDPDVRFGADQTGGVRVAAVSHIDEPRTVPIRVSRGKAKQYKVEPLVNAPTATGEDAGQAAALQALTEAASRGTDALANLWKQKGMAPYRDALQLDLERLKSVAADADKGEPEQAERPAEQPPEVNDADPIASTLTKIRDAFDERELQAIEREIDGSRDLSLVTPEQCDRLDEALAAKRAQLREKAAAE